MGFLINIILNTLTVMISVYLIKYLDPSAVSLNGWVAAFWVAIILGLINTFIKPVVKLLTLPITMMTLGIFSIIINGIMILLVSAFVPGFSVNGLLWAIVFSLILSTVGWFVGLIKS